MMNKYVIGIDFGTDSCRTLLVNTGTGEELASVIEYYTRWIRGLLEFLLILPVRLRF